MNKPLLVSAIIACAASGAMAKSVEFSYGNDSKLQWGAKTAQSYDIAVLINNPSLIGQQVTAIDVPVLTSDQISGYSIWMSSELSLVKDESGKNVNYPDILSDSVEVTGVSGNLGTIRYELAEPYTIPDAGVYVGYSFDVAKISDDTERYPVVCSSGATEGAFFVHTSKTYRAWKDYSESLGVSSNISISVSGTFQDNQASIVSVPSLYTTAGKKTQATVLIANHGFNAIETATFDFSVKDGISETINYVFDTPVAPKFDTKQECVMEFPALDLGKYEYTLTLTSVNGEKNPDMAASASGTLEVMPFVPVKRPLMEEYTGLWCGWCPRGFVALELMNEWHPDFVAVSYHNGDEMAYDGPVNTEGYPSARMDRTVYCDPFYGSSNDDMGIEALWQELSDQFTPAEISVKAEWANDSLIEVTSVVDWAATPQIDGEYRVEYVLVADGLTKASWYQSNYYAQYSATTYLEDFCNGGKYGKSAVYGLVFNDVAVLNSGNSGVKGSVASTETGSSNEYTYLFNINDTKVIQDVNNLRVVAILLAITGSNDTYGTVINCAKGTIGSTTALKSVMSSDSPEVDVRYFDLSGRMIANPSNGIFIKSVVRADGTVTNSKVSM